MLCELSVFFSCLFLFFSPGHRYYKLLYVVSLSTMKLLLENGADWKKTDRVSMIIIKLEFQSLMYVSSL